MSNRMTKEEYEAQMLGKSLSVQGKSTDHIWTMCDVDGYIGIRFDCGDSGTLYLTEAQALSVIEELQIALGLRPNPKIIICSLDDSDKAG